MELFALIIGAPPTTDFFFLASQVTFLKSQSQNKAAKGRCLERIRINGAFIALLSNRWSTKTRRHAVVGAAEPATARGAGNRSRSVRPHLIAHSHIASTLLADQVIEQGRSFSAVGALFGSCRLNAECLQLREERK
jgi:hypothetical protein